MHIAVHAQERPNDPAVTMSDGRALSFRQLDHASLALANRFHELGLRSGDVIAVLMENRPEYYVATWAAQRMGLYYVPINWHLKADEVAYITADSEAVVMVTSAQHREIAARACAGSRCTRTINVDDADWDVVREAIASPTPPPTQHVPAEGQVMFYSSGTTGKPKGIKRALDGRPFGTSAALDKFLSAFYGIGAQSVYLSPAPLYHAAPLGWTMAIQRAGGAIVCMTQFDALETLRLIHQHRITHAQFVPTMFVRMLKLPSEQRLAFDVSSLKMAVHAAAPCPPDVKRAMFEWWGPIIHEYYGGSEVNGLCAVGPQDWFTHPGTVGKAALGVAHICDDEGNELPVGETGAVYFSGMPPFEYFKDPEKTRSAHNAQGWSTLGDIGHMDADGYVYLTDRKAFMIISGGVNVYPQEVENVLIGHPAVMDVAVIGVPHPELGEEVLAAVQLREASQASDALKAELIAFCREQIAHFKCPRRVEFDNDLPRLPNGKLLKRLIKNRYTTA
jgi:long-chain acyl-CoA synthetase